MRFIVTSIVLIFMYTEVLNASENVSSTPDSWYTGSIPRGLTYLVNMANEHTISNAAAEGKNKDINSCFLILSLYFSGNSIKSGSYRKTVSAIHPKFICLIESLIQNEAAHCQELFPIALYTLSESIEVNDLQKETDEWKKLQQLVSVIKKSQNPDGSWGQLNSVLSQTTWTLLALQKVDVLINDESLKETLDRSVSYVLQECDRALSSKSKNYAEVIMLISALSCLKRSDNIVVKLTDSLLTNEFDQHERDKPDYPCLFLLRNAIKIMGTKTSYLIMINNKIQLTLYDLEQADGSKKNGTWMSTIERSTYTSTAIAIATLLNYQCYFDVENIRR